MGLIDADAHVIESEATWAHLEPEFHAKRPVPVTLPDDTAVGPWNAFWIIDERMQFFGAVPATGKLAREKSFSVPSQTLSPVRARLADLDRIGIDRQVIHPSCCLLNLCQDPVLEQALMRSYNTFLAEKHRESEGRLLFDLQVAWRRPDLACAEIRRVAGLGGAVAVFMRGLEWDHPIDDPCFYPIFAEAERHDLAIAIHLGSGSPGMRRIFEGVPRVPGEDPFFPPRSKRLITVLTVQYAFYRLMESPLLSEFPRLRWVFLEGGGSEWVGPALSALARGGVANARRGIDEGRVFVACEPDEDFETVVAKIGSDCLVVASDMPHFDESAHSNVAAEYAARTDVPPSVMDKMLRTNAMRLYGLKP
ncbi:MAG: amidohydrolase family protein [Rhodospirillales bacterium]